MIKQEPKEWRAITDRYFTPKERTIWAEIYAKMGDGFDHDAYQAQWNELGARIEEALPLSPQSKAAQVFVDEWFALLKPFTEVATPEIWATTVAMYDDMDNWPQSSGRKADPGFGKSVWDFMKLATAARYAAGGAINCWPDGTKQLSEKE